MADHSQINRDILRRVRWLYAFFLVAAVAIFAKVVWVQYGPDGAELREMADKIVYEYEVIPAERGDVLSGDGRLLASSITQYHIYMDFAAGGLTDEIFNENVDSLAHCLSAMFGDKSKAAYKGILQNARNNKAKNRYKRITEKRISYMQEKEVSRFPIFRMGRNRGGYMAVAQSIRVMPHGALAKRTIGMVNEDGVKIGVEGAFDDQLRGKQGRSLTQKISGTFRVPVPDEGNVEPVSGMDVVTTIDVDIQDVAETWLRKQLEAGGADWGTVVLMEVATGEIHAMANLTRKSPGVYQEDFNYAIGRRMEPGSTFKLATLITLLDDAGMSLEQTIDCENGFARVGAVPNIKDDHRESVITLKRVFEVSSNIGFAKAVHGMYSQKPDRFVNFVKKMGLGEPLGMQIPGEKEPLFKDPSVRQGGDLRMWDATTLVRMAYGYAFEITPMHTVALYNAVANNGKMMRPLLVKEIQSYGQTVRRFEPEVINPSICSAKTLGLVREALEGVVEDGTAARSLRNPYYKVAAKTGTAQMPMDNGGYTDARGGRNYLATMVGYFPADNPKYTCIVAMKTYNGPGNRNTYYGASLAGPIFRAIADRVYASHPTWHETVDTKGERTIPPASDIKGGSKDAVTRVAGKLSIPLEAQGGKDSWVQVKAGEKKSEAVSVETEDEFLVPSVAGMGLRDAVYLLESKGLQVSFSGRGKVNSQSVEAGSRINKGQIVMLTLGI